MKGRDFDRQSMFVCVLDRFELDEWARDALGLGPGDAFICVRAGGYCGILAMANTDPPVSTAADVAALREEARASASIPVGFMATVTRDMAGAELTEMVELREAGAVGFSDDGLPISNARVMRRARMARISCPRRSISRLRSTSTL